MSLEYITKNSLELLLADIFGKKLSKQPWTYIAGWYKQRSIDVSLLQQVVYTPFIESSELRECLGQFDLFDCNILYVHDERTCAVWKRERIAWSTASLLASICHC